MKIYTLIPLSCAVLLLSACSQMMSKQASQSVASAAPMVLPAPPTPPIQEDAPSAYYQSNTQKFGQPLNPAYEEQYAAYKAQVKVIDQQNYQTKMAAYHKLVLAMQQRQAAVKAESSKFLGKPDEIAPINVQQAMAVTELPLPEAPKILIPKHTTTAKTATAEQEQIDVAAIDHDLAFLESKARHYAPVFKSKIERKVAEVKLKNLLKTLNAYADEPNASYDVLVRAMKANVIARNMDVGNDAAERGITYFGRLLKLKPKDPETSFWYGFSLAEGGGFKEAIPHLNIAIKAGYQEAHLALANTYMLMEQKKNAISTLTTYKTKFPDDAANADHLIEEINGGQRFSVWQFIPAPTPVTVPSVTSTPPATTAANTPVVTPSNSTAN